jgi:asparagine synthase (glutamine-hydrolysing)
MFTFGLWDDRSRHLSLARDPHGIKPLYVCRNPDRDGAWSLIFASELRAIMASGLLGRARLNPDAVSSVVWNGFVMGPQTIVAGIEAVRPGTVTTVDVGSHVVREADFESLERTGTETPRSTADLAATLQECIRLHLTADVPLGVFLSAGVDSGVVANLAQRAQPDSRVKTFTLAFDDATLSEAAPARAIARAIGTEHHEIMLTEASFVSDLERALDTLDQPTFDGLNSYYMSRAVRDAGLTVALAGTGGDELFGGYDTFRSLPPLVSWARRSSWVPSGPKQLLAKGVVVAKRPRGTTTVGPQTRWAKLPDLVRAGTDLIGLYQLSYALFLPEFQQELLGASTTPLPDGLPAQMAARLRTETKGRSTLSALGVLEQRCFLGERLLRDSDAASMAVALELRVPLVDRELTRCVDGLADDTRFGEIGRKQALRDAGLVGLDPALFERPKQGFQLPFDRWIRQNLGDAMDATMRDRELAESIGLDGAAVVRLWEAFHDGAPGIFWSRVWAIYVLMRWCARHQITL